MSKPKTTIAEQLSAAQLAIANSLSDPEIAASVAAYGYPAEKLAEGHALYESARAAVEAQKIAAGAQQQATADLIKAATAAHEAYQSLAKVARAVAGKVDLTALGLAGREPRDTAGLILAGYTLFDNAGSLPELAVFGYDAARLSAERAKVAVFDRLNQRQEAAKGAAQQTTQEQATALAELNAWTAQYLKIARVALRDKPQLLEKIGVSARTAPTAAQRAARKKAGTTSTEKQGG